MGYTKLPEPIPGTGTGDITGGVSLGGGGDVFKEKSGTELIFKSIAEGDKIDIVESGTELTISSLPPDWGDITGTLSDQADLQSALNAKQDTLAFTPEDVTNKATNFSTINNTLYPSVEAVEERVQAIPNFIGEDGTSSGVKGLVPAPAVLDGQTKSKFLMADGTWSGQTEYHTSRNEALTAIGGWTQASTSFLPFGLIYAEDKQLYVAVNSSTSANFQTSRDGKTWRNAAVPFANTWTKGAYSPELGRFVAVSFAGANRSVYSDDGINWTLSSISNVVTWYDVCWSPQLRLFCAVGLTGGVGIATSLDGITWTNRTVPDGSTTNFYSVCWSPELSLFCTVRLAGAAYTSPDGINWTSRPSIGNKSWSRVIWAKELGLFVAVGVAGTNRCATSPDGITWTERVISARAWRSVAWSAELGMLLAVASGGQIAYSFDGITWTDGTNPQATNQWYDVHWSKHLGQFIIAGITGTAKLMRSRYTRSFVPANHMEWARPVIKSVGTAFTLNENQKYATIVKTTGGAQTITIPENATYPAPIGFEGRFVQAGTDTITFAPASGSVTIISRGGLLSTSGQGAVVTIQKIDVNEWVLSGDLA